jgi:hypothetical protein
MKSKPKLPPKSALPAKTTPKDVFLHLLMLVMLYLVVISLITISFAYVDYWYPDPLNYYSGGALDGIRFSSSMLIVSFPILLVLSWFIQRDLYKVPQKHELKFSKWLTYLTLFVSAITIVIDLIQLVHRFYGGDLTTPFALKVLSVLVLTGAVFSYYVWDVQSEPHKSKVPRVVAWISSVVVIGMLVAGFFIAGSPTEQRAIRMDEQRIGDLQNIQYEVINYWQYKQELPASLDTLRNDITGFVPPIDPETKTPYEYAVVEPLKFKLCAIFNRPNPYNNDQAGVKTIPVPYYNGYPSPTNQTWDHEEGQKCFERTIDPELYPKLNK